MATPPRILIHPHYPLVPWQRFTFSTRPDSHRQSIPDYANDSPAVAGLVAMATLPRLSVTTSRQSVDYFCRFFDIFGSLSHGWPGNVATSLAAMILIGLIWKHVATPPHLVLELGVAISLF